eukprot:CAMPEP_0172609418 /NCGR_PEP_ID=MMETSP1068-20121228/29422_1 /TAXON_ID=35684 /ORGANISM="Pseudopedinella elastica, Strain CCMP716" /LENGTH=66 /DNA_ID=CAMNT_0013412931 /DNA_START=73 /DNA_END=274 /DNA_ORIENTATION=-
MPAKLLDTGAKDEGGLEDGDQLLGDFQSVWTRPTPAGAFEHVTKPKNAAIGGKKGDACHARVLRAG